jgi:uncharacterized membrane protein
MRWRYPDPHVDAVMGRAEGRVARERTPAPAGQGEIAMPHIEESIHISRPVAEVFAFATDPANQLLINTNMVAYDSDGPMQKGTHTSGAAKVAGKRISWTSEVTEYEQDRRVELRSIDAPMDFHISWLYEPDGDGTQVRFVQEVDSLGGFFGRLSDPVVTRMYSGDVRSNLENLKILLEEANA